MKRSLRLRWRVLERDGFTCIYCGRSAPDVRLEVDHVVPVSHGGRTVDDNLATACWDCNRGKSAIDASGALDIRRRLLTVNREANEWYEFARKILDDLDIANDEIRDSEERIERLTQALDEERAGYRSELIHIGQIRGPSTRAN